MITAGIDCGARNAKSVIMKDGKIIGRAKIRTGYDTKEAVSRSLNLALTKAGITLDEVQNIAGAGSGKKSIEMAHVRVDDAVGMAKGAHYFFPKARTVVDVGAEEGRAVKIDNEGNVKDVVIQERCAAGAGAFIESMARALEVSLEEMGTLCLQSNQKIPMNAQCVIFAESEVVGLIHAGTKTADISKAVHDAMAGRIVSMIRRLGVDEDVVLIGGVGRNPGFVDCLKRELNLGNLCIPQEPEYGAAVGASVVAAEEE